MNAVNAQNFEEAANIAAEFIYSVLSALQAWVLWLTNHAGLDNLPNEVNHLLQEIKIKEARAQGKSMFSGLGETRAQRSKNCNRKSIKTLLATSAIP